MGRTIWIDFENTPHVPFFLPIIHDLEERGYSVILTARDFAQTKELLEQLGRKAKVIGGEYGGNSLSKSFGLLLRAIRLARYIRGRDVPLAIGHGSRGLTIAARLLGIRSLTLYDYEGASVRLFNTLSNYVMTPEVVTFDILAKLGLPRRKYLSYPGLKESVYLSAGSPSDELSEELHIQPVSVVVTVRPPSATAHYRNDRSQHLFEEIMALLVSRADVQLVLLPRNEKQRNVLVSRYSGFRNVIIPPKAIEAVSLLHLTDLVVGGGGTMNREAAVLGVPVVSIFKGPQGAVDRSLVEQGKMVEIESAKQIFPLLHKRDPLPPLPAASAARKAIVEAIVRLVEGQND